MKRIFSETLGLVTEEWALTLTIAGFVIAVFMGGLGGIDLGLLLVDPPNL